MYLMAMILEEATTFRYDESTDEIIYCSNFDQTNPSLLNLDSEQKLCSDRLQSLTTWTPESDLKLDWVT